MFEPRWTPHGLVRRLLHEPGVRRVDISVLLDGDLSRSEPEGSRMVGACSHCTQDAPTPPGAVKSFCMSCGRGRGWRMPVSSPRPVRDHWRND